MSVDTSWYRDVNDFARHTTWLNGTLAAYALWGGLVALVALYLVCWWTGRFRTDAVSRFATLGLAGGGTIIALILNQQLLSPSIARERPCNALTSVQSLLTCDHDYSMPSDHCVIAGAITAGLLILDRRLGAIASVLALLLAFSRVYVGVHYPSDTLVGLAFGAAVAIVVVVGLGKLATRIAEALTRTPLRAVVTARPAAAAATAG